MHSEIKKTASGKLEISTTMQEQTQQGTKNPGLVANAMKSVHTTHVTHSSF